MRRFAAGLLGLALATALNGDMAWHVHDYDQHGHPEHRHGLAAHQHEFSTHAQDDALRIEACEADQHVIRLTFVCSTAVQTYGLNVELPSGGTPIVLILLDQAVRFHEVRVHGPPQRTYAPLRAPPSHSRLTI